MGLNFRSESKFFFIRWETRRLVEVASEIPGDLFSTLRFWAIPVVGSSNDEEECADDVGFGLTFRGVTFAGDVVDSFCFLPIRSTL